MPTVLLVEDTPTDERFAVKALTRAGVRNVEIARDGEEALNYLNDPEHPCPRFVLLDLKLPKLNGIELLNILRQSDKTKICPVVIFSSSNEREEVANCFKCGANSYVRKPTDYDEYLEVLAKTADYWISVNQMAAG